MDAAIAALIGAGIGFTGGLIQKAIDLRAERDRWLRSRRDAVRRDAHLAAAEVATKLAALVHSTMWFTYSLDEANASSWAALHDKFDQETHELIASLKGAEVRLAAIDKRLHDVFNPLVSEGIRLSESADAAVIELTEHQKRGAQSILAVNREALEFIKDLPRRIADVLGQDEDGRAA